MERCGEVCSVDRPDGVGYDGGSIGDLDGVGECAGALEWRLRHNRDESLVWG